MAAGTGMAACWLYRCSSQLAQHRPASTVLHTLRCECSVDTQPILYACCKTLPVLKEWPEATTTQTEEEFIVPIYVPPPKQLLVRASSECSVHIRSQGSLSRPAADGAGAGGVARGDHHTDQRGVPVPIYEPPLAVCVSLSPQCS